MYVNLFGEEMLEREEYAKVLIGLSHTRPVYDIKRKFDIEHQISFRIYNEEEYVYLSDVPGIYMIFRVKNDTPECLYVGETDRSIRNRIYRFIKELEGKSRHDEKHPGATRARLDGVKSTDNLFVRVIHKTDILSKIDPYYYHVYDSIDEDIAYIMKSRYNIKVSKKKWPTNPKSVLLG